MHISFTLNTYSIFNNINVIILNINLLLVIIKYKLLFSTKNLIIYIYKSLSLFINLFLIC